MFYTQLVSNHVHFLRHIEPCMFFVRRGEGRPLGIFAARHSIFELHPRGDSIIQRLELIGSLKKC